MNLRLCDWEGCGITVTKSDEHRTPINPIASDQDEKVVLDLHVGRRVCRTPDQPPAPFGKILEIRPHECLRVETDEMIITPNNVFGLVCCRHSMSARGLWVANAKIDPLFGATPNHGHTLLITVMNTMKRKITLVPGEAFCSIFFSQLINQVDGYPRFPKDAPGAKKRLRERLLYKIEPYWGHIITGIVGPIVVFFMLHFLGFIPQNVLSKSPTQGQQSTPPQTVAPTRPSPTPTNATPRTP
jgi:deoxycytidine triphosphate deaminase